VGTHGGIEVFDWFGMDLGMIGAAGTTTSYKMERTIHVGWRVSQSGEYRPSFVNENEMKQAVLVFDKRRLGWSGLCLNVLDCA